MSSIETTADPMLRAQQRIDSITEAERAAVRRLYEYAQSDTEQGEAVAAFLLAWWWSSMCGGFPITDAFYVEDAVATDIVTGLAVALRTRVLPDYFGLKMEPLVRKWRPTVAKELDDECEWLVGETARPSRQAAYNSAGGAR